MSFIKKIKNQVLTNHPFALIRLPKENTIFLLLEDYKGQNAYSFISFDSSKKYELNFSDFQEVSLSELNEEIHFPLSLKENTKVISKDSYLNLLKKTILFLQEEKAHKIVISREKWVGKTEILPIQSFLFLCEKYPNSFCHLSFWNTEEVWIGATPEVLGTFENSIFRTMSLAGTLPDDDFIHWEEKEIEEQQFVTDYIHEKLSCYSSDISLDGPKSLHLGLIKHLVTYFSVQLKDSAQLSKLIEDLHPTPAVCGLPLNISKNFILKEESYNRDFYTGYIGLESPEFKKYFVNLRSAKLYKNGASLFVGGGIIAQSNLEKEWEETELKSKFIEDNL